MILSMTGFGKSEKKNKDFTFSVEVKSLNNRFIEVTTKTPYYMSQYDKDIVSLVKKECLRGKIIVNVNIASNNANSLILNKTKLNAVMELSKEISKQTNLENNLLLSDVINFPNVYEEKKLIETNSNKRLLLGTVKDALKDLYTFRSIEGNNLKKDIDKKIKKIEIVLSRVKKKSQTNSKIEVKKLTKKINHILKNVNNLDKDRLYQEVALSIEKKDINEEIIRLNSHIQIFKNCLNNKENTGKKMNFILQEMIREINTIGSKTDKIDVNHMVVNLKNYIEQIKEQVQNIL
tara:strand:+ start:156 stop:1028 length:873 start_codon:yes stop_codon:yes gene_type:complete